MSDLISRQAAIEAIKNCESGENFEYNEGLIDAMNAVVDTPSAREWIPITTRPMTEDERKEWSEKLDFNINDDDEAIIYGNLPDDGVEKQED